LKFQYGKELSLLYSITTSYGVHPAYPKDSGALFPEVKQPGCEADLSPPTSTEVKKTLIYTSIPHLFMAWSLFS
jgi:hypothetical protein